MTPHELLHELGRIGITLSIKDNRLEVNAPEGVLSTEWQQKIVENKAALMQLASAGAGTVTTPRRLLAMPGVAPTVAEAVSEQKQRLYRQQQSRRQAEAILDEQVGMEWRKLSETELKAFAEDLHGRKIDCDRIRCLVSCLFELTGQPQRDIELGWAVPWWYQEKEG